MKTSPVRVKARTHSLLKADGSAPAAAYPRGPRRRGRAISTRAALRRRRRRVSHVPEQKGIQISTPGRTRLLTDCRRSSWLASATR